MVSDLAFALAAMGQEVLVVTSRQCYNSRDVTYPARETVKGVNVVRIRTTGFGRYFLFGRAFDYITFFLGLAWCLMCRTRPSDILIAKTDPPLLSLIAVPIARLRGAKVVNWLQDLFPEVAEAAGLGHGRLTKRMMSMLRGLRDRSLRAADANVVPGERMAMRLLDCQIPGTTVHCIPNWANDGYVTSVPHELNPVRAEWGLSNKFTVAYSGNMGRAHECETLLEAIALLEACSDTLPDTIGSPAAGNTAMRREVAFVIIGGGTTYQALERAVRQRSLTSIQFRPYQPRQHLANSLSLADVHLVNLRPEFEGFIVPSKYYGIAAAGRACIFIGDEDGEIARIVQADGAGATVRTGDSAGLAQIIRDLASNPGIAAKMGSRAREAFEQRHDFAHALERWRGLLLEVQLNRTRELSAPSGEARPHATCAANSDSSRETNTASL